MLKLSRALKFARTYATHSPLEQYDINVEKGLIRSDEYQRKTLDQLNSVYTELKEYKPHTAKSVFTKFFKSAAQHGPKGIYMYGDVGCGKTMLMDMFYTTVPEHLTKKRIHFHAFMQDIHHQEFNIKQKQGTRNVDAMAKIAQNLAKEANVLCLDEIQVIDVADAMILRSLFQGLYENGVVTFFTSNREPNDLYKNGVQRESFIPCIRMIEQRNHVQFLKSPVDYRKLPRPESGCYYFNSPEKTPEENTKSAQLHANKWFDYFAKGVPAANDRTLETWGRPITIPKSAGDKVAQFTFMEMCGTFRSAADYLEICKNFHAIILTDIPTMSLEQTDLVRRFITFLDAVYDTHTKFAASAAKPWDSLFTTDHLTINPETNEVMFKSSGKEGDLVEMKNFSGAEEMFAFARALSRLKHMSSEQWLNDAST